MNHRGCGKGLLWHHCFSGLLELEAGLPPSVMEPRIKVPRPKVTKGYITRSARRELELMKTHQVKSSWVLFTLHECGRRWGSDRYPPELSFPTRLWRRRRAVWWKRSLCGSSLRQKNLFHDLQPLRWKTRQRYRPHSCCTQFSSSF